MENAPKHMEYGTKMLEIRFYLETGPEKVATYSRSWDFSVIACRRTFGELSHNECDMNQELTSFFDFPSIALFRSVGMRIIVFVLTVVLSPHNPYPTEDGDDETCASWLSSPLLSFQRSLSIFSVSV